VSGAKLKGSVSGAEWMAPFYSPIINDAGQVAFVATLEGPGIEEYQSRALYATDTAGLLHLIVREGQMFDVGGGDLRRIASVGLNSEDASENGSSAFNSSGQLAFYLSFEDTSNGVFVATVPEPVMASWFVLMLLSSKRRKRL